MARGGVRGNPQAADAPAGTSARTGSERQRDRRVRRRTSRTQVSRWQRRHVTELPRGHVAVEPRHVMSSARARPATLACAEEQGFGTGVSPTIAHMLQAAAGHYHLARRGRPRRAIETEDVRGVTMSRSSRFRADPLLALRRAGGALAARGRPGTGSGCRAAAGPVLLPGASQARLPTATTGASPWSCRWSTWFASGSGEWRAAGYPGVTRTTLELLHYWRRDGRQQRLFFAQLEAAETIIFLTEARRDLRQGIDVPLDEPSDEQKAELGYSAFRRYACKMATGSGKTTVMGMLAAWSILNKVHDRANARLLRRRPRRLPERHDPQPARGTRSAARRSQPLPHPRPGARST